MKVLRYTIEVFLDKDCPKNTDSNIRRLVDSVHSFDMGKAVMTRIPDDIRPYVTTEVSVV
jgi:hypothetical protein